MSSVSIVAAPLSRPKIHRVPAHLLRPVKPEPSISPVVLAVLFGLTGVAYMADMYAKQRNYAPPADAALPTLTPSQPTQSQSQGEMAPAAGAAEALNAAVENDAAAITHSDNGKTITITDRNGGIVGQMARIPMQNEQITEVKTVSKVDNQAGRELLSIISKY